MISGESSTHCYTHSFLVFYELMYGYLCDRIVAAPSPYLDCGYPHSNNNVYVPRMMTIYHVSLMTVIDNDNGMLWSVNEQAMDESTHSIDLDGDKYFPKVRVELHYDLLIVLGTRCTTYNL